MTPIIIPIGNGDGPSGPLTPLPAMGIGIVLAIIGLMLCAMLWDTRDVLYDGWDDIPGAIVLGCLGILSLGLLLTGIGFFIFGAWGFIF